MSKQIDLPQPYQVLPAFDEDIKERIERAVFELFTAGMWFDIYDLRGGHVGKDDVEHILPFADSDASPNADLVFNFRFRIPNRGPVRDAFDEILAARAESEAKSLQEQLAIIDKRIAELQEQRAALAKTDTEVSWEEPKDTMAHPSFHDE